MWDGSHAIAHSMRGLQMMCINTGEILMVYTVNLEIVS